MEEEFNFSSPQLNLSLAQFSPSLFYIIFTDSCRPTVEVEPIKVVISSWRPNTLDIAAQFSRTRISGLSRPFILVHAESIKGFTSWIHYGHLTLTQRYLQKMSYPIPQHLVKLFKTFCQIMKLQTGTPLFVRNQYERCCSLGYWIFIRSYTFTPWLK